MNFLIPLATLSLMYYLIVRWSNKSIKEMEARRKQHPKVFRIPKKIDISLDETEEAISR